MTITLKNVPRSLHLSLKRRAKLHQRSLNQEALHCLGASIEGEERRKKAFAEIVRYRDGLARRGVPGMTRTEVRQAIRQGRA